MPPRERSRSPARPRRGPPALVCVYCDVPSGPVCPPRVVARCALCPERPRIFFCLEHFLLHLEVDHPQ